MSNETYGLEELRTWVEHAGLTVSAVSKWSVGMHLHHCCLAMAGVCKALASADAPPPEKKSSMAASIIFSSGRIPRGSAKASDTVIPRPDFSRSELLELLDACERGLREANGLDSSAWFEHSFFGVLTRDKALKFVRMHNDHHLKIIADVKKV